MPYLFVNIAFLMEMSVSNILKTDKSALSPDYNYTLV